jgi:hypothetical protein
MALDFFNTQRGIGLDDAVLILQGAGIPGLSTDTIGAQVGSIYMDTTVDANGLQFWWKSAVGSGNDKWSQGVSTSFAASVASGLHWREPVQLLDSTSTVVPSTGSVDGVALSTLAAGSRVLFTGLTSGSNVYVWSGTAFVPDTTVTLSAGDALLVTSGTSKDQQWIYDTSIGWFQFGGSTIAEMDNIAAFVGKEVSGSNYPVYASQQIVTDGQNLVLGISQIDDALGSLQFSTHNVVSNVVKGLLVNVPGTETPSTLTLTQVIDALDATFGNGIITNTSAHYSLDASMEWGTSGSLTITDALNLLNNNIGNLSYTNGSTPGYVLQNSPVDTVTQAISVLNDAFGALTSSSAYSVSSNNAAGGYLSNVAIAGNTIQQTFDAFNAELGTLAVQNLSTTTTNIIPGTVQPLEPTAAQLSTTLATEVTWLVQVKDSSGARQAFRVHALTDGTNVDYTLYGKIKVGSVIGGDIGFDVNIVGGNFVASLNPSNAAGTLTCTLKREAYSYLA